MDKTKYEITIKTDSNKEKYRLGDLIHNQLVGHTDYINNNIILNIDKDKTVRLWIYNDCSQIPEIKLF